MLTSKYEKHVTGKTCLIKGTKGAYDRESKTVKIFSTH